MARSGVLVKVVSMMRQRSFVDHKRTKSNHRAIGYRTDPTPALCAQSFVVFLANNICKASLCNGSL